MNSGIHASRHRVLNLLLVMSGVLIVGIVIVEIDRRTQDEAPQVAGLLDEAAVIGSASGQRLTPCRPRDDARVGAKPRQTASRRFRGVCSRTRVGDSLGSPTARSLAAARQAAQRTRASTSPRAGTLPRQLDLTPSHRPELLRSDRLTI